MSATYEPKVNDYSKISLAPLASVESIKSNCKRIPEERLNQRDGDEDEEEDEDEEREGSKTPVNQANHAPTLSTLRKSSNIVDDMVNNMTKASVTDGLLDVKSNINASDSLKKLIQDSKVTSELHLNKNKPVAAAAAESAEPKMQQQQAISRKSDLGLRNSLHRTKNFTESMLEKDLIKTDITLASSDLSLSDSIDSASNMASRIVSCPFMITV